jgi:hypothetical protein
VARQAIDGIGGAQEAGSERDWELRATSHQKAVIVTCAATSESMTIEIAQC